MRGIFLSIDFWKFALPLFGAVIAWFVNEWRKRILEQYQRKEASYKELVRCLRGFYVGAHDSERLKADFLDQLNQCWLYCPDEVIERGYGFLDTVHTQQVHSDEVKEKAMGDFVAAIRRDLLSRKLVSHTRLTGSDFRHLGVNK
ncbi:MAG: hypothetical protein ACREOW_14140 [Thermodesulfobacteriota bacterium]